MTGMVDVPTPRWGANPGTTRGARRLAHALNNPPHTQEAHPSGSHPEPTPRHRDTPARKD